MPYALLGMVTDYDCWRDDTADVDVTDILSVMTTNAALARRTIARLAATLPQERIPSPIDTILDNAIVTGREAWDPRAVRRLDAVAGRIMQTLPRRGA